MRLVITLCLLFCPLGASHLPIRLFTTADGLPHNWVTCIRRDAIGYLWFGTRDGLARFDGYSFSTYGRMDGLTGTDVSDLLLTREGDLWVGTTSGLFRFQPSAQPRFRAYSSSMEVNASRIGTLAQDRDGTIWIGTAGGLYRMDPRGDPSRPPIPVDLPIAGGKAPVSALLADRAGTLWIAAGAIYRRWPDGRTEPQPGLGPAASGNRPLLETADGKVWIGGGSLLRVDAGGTPGKSLVEQRYSDADGLRKGAKILFQTSDGRLWIHSVTGLSHLLPEAPRGEPPIRPYGPADRLAADSVQALGEDREGSLWIGCTFGAMKVLRSAFISYDKTDGLGDTRVASIFENQTGGLFAITTGETMQGGGVPFINRWEGSRFRAIPIRPPGSRVFSDSWNQIALFDRAGAFWSATTDGGLCRYPLPGLTPAGSGSPGACYTTHDKASQYVAKIFADSRGDIWVSMEVGATGLMRWDRQTGTLHSYSVADGIPARSPEAAFRTPSAFAEDRTGAIWIGSTQWIARYRDGRFTVFTDREKFRNLFVTDLHLDHAGRLWVAGNLGGLYRVEDPGAERPAFRPYTTSQGLSSDRVLCVTSDRWGRIYVCTGRGVDRLDPDSNSEPVHIRHYTVADGLALGTPQEAFRDRSGTLWFGTLNGLSALTPEPDEPRAPPPVLISGLQIRGVRQPLSELGQARVSGLTLAAGDNQIEIGYVGLGFAAGEMLRYQVRLEGSDTDWNTPTGQRSVNYASLAPGRYRFLVRALNSDGQASAQPAAVEFTVLAPVWQRWWFLSGCGVVFAAAIYFLSRYRLRQALAVERVRMRIATDLHDDVGSSLSQIAILSEVLLDRMASPEPLQADPVRRIAGMSRELIDSMSDIVWAISPRHDRLLDLTRRMREFAEEMLVPLDLELDFQATIPADLRAGAEVRRQVYLIFKECIHNVVRHAACSRVTVLATIEQAGLLLIVTDNGCGFERRPGEGNGLRSMLQRARGLGGVCTVESQPGKGTSVRIVIPARTLRA